MNASPEILQFTFHVPLQLESAGEFISNLFQILLTIMLTAKGFTQLRSVYDAYVLSRISFQKMLYTIHDSFGLKDKRKPIHIFLLLELSKSLCNISHFSHNRPDFGLQKQTASCVMFLRKNKQTKNQNRQSKPKCSNTMIFEMTVLIL